MVTVDMAALLQSSTPKVKGLSLAALAVTHQQAKHSMQEKCTGWQTAQSCSQNVKFDFCTVGA